MIFMSDTKPFITLFFITLCVVVFLIEPKDQNFEVDVANPINRFFAFTPDLAFSLPWTFVTSIFMHANPSHLLVNMFVLFMFGSFLENRIGPRKYMLIFFATGIVGNLGYMISSYALQNTFLAPYYSPTVLGLGASGAIYGILGTLAILEPYAIVYVFFVPMPMIIAAIVWGLIEIFGIFAPAGIASGAHLGGLFLGLVIGYILHRQRKRVRVIHYSSF